MNILHVLLLVCCLYYATGSYSGIDRGCHWGSRYYRHGNTYFDTASCKTYRCQDSMWMFVANGCRWGRGCYRLGQYVYYRNYRYCYCRTNGIRC